MGHDGLPGRRITQIASVAIFLALLWTLLVGIAPNVNTRIVQTGELFWPGYAAQLRTDPEAPTCDLAEIDQQLQACPADAAAAPVPANGGDDPFGGEDPFAEDAGGQPADEDPFGGEDPFAAAEPAASGEDPFGGEDPFAAAAGGTATDADDPFGGEDPFAAAAAKPEVNCAALQALRERCEARHTLYEQSASRITPSVKVFRTVEGYISGLATFPWWRELLVVVVVLGSLVTTLHRMHIALRDPKTLLEHRVRQAAELLAVVLLIASNVADWQVQAASTAETDNPLLPVLWAVGLGVLGLVNLYHLVRPPKDLEAGSTTIPRLLMVIPLHAWMVILAGMYFLGVEGHPSGQAIYLHKFVQHPNVYLGIGLYIWSGMLLSRTRIAPMSFNVLLPWKLPPAILAWLVVVLAAFPTAYSGASGIFVLAAGAVIFDRLRKAGATPRMALTATAMSGSLGVVLRPCLVVVLIAVLNKQVTTDELFGYGFGVYVLTCTLFLAAMLIRNQDGFHVAPVSEALGPSFAALRRVAPYGLIAVGVVVLFALGLSTWLNEHTAPFVVPVTMLALVIFDKWRGAESDDEEDWQPLWPALLTATRESSHHVGALLMLMACSVALGGMVERSEIMYAVVPESFGSTWLAMAFLVLVMVLVGMTMDALGAVILVSFTVAKIAYDNGIAPIHFWMMVLVAFELGYLTPPVALNHLLARQVIGAPSHVEDHPVEGGFVARYEHIVVPMAVMGTALVLVAFVPLLFY